MGQVIHPKTCMECKKEYPNHEPHCSQYLSWDDIDWLLGTGRWGQ